MDRLSNLFRNLGNSLELEEIFSTLDEELRRLIVYRAMAVLLLEDDGPVTAYRRGEQPDPAWFQRSPGKDVLAHAVRECPPTLHSLDFRSSSSGQVLVFPVEHVLAQARHVAAVLVLHLCNGSEPSSEHLQILRNLAPKLGASIANARKYQRAEQLAEVEPSTGLANVRSLFQRLDAELSRARRSRTTLAVLQCSIQGFDRSGLLCSPLATRSTFERVASRLRENCREYDFTARAGDELVLVLPDFRPEFLDDKRASIGRIVEETGLSAGLPLFAAIGAAMFPDEGSDAEDLLATAAHRVVLARQSAAPGAPAEY